MKVVFLIRSLEIGGAERQLAVLAAALARRNVQAHVLTFYPGGPIARDLQQAGVTVTDLGKRGRWDIPVFMVRLIAALRRERWDVLHSFLPVANILTVAVRPFFPGMRVAWGVRASNMDLTNYDWLSRVVFGLECWLSRGADLIVANSQAGRDYHVAHGFPAEKMVVVPNGIDTTHFRFDPQGRRRVRAEWGFEDEQRVIGLVARLDPMKDHSTFLEAAVQVAQRYPNVKFVCVGDGPGPYRDKLIAYSRSLGLPGRIFWVGIRHDMPAVYSAVDVACSSSSFGEGFSNVIAEAMACERSCVVTDVGDSAWIVGDLGWTVPPRNASALAAALERVLIEGNMRNTREWRDPIARERIVTRFSIDRMVEDIQALYAEVARNILPHSQN